MRRNLDGVYFRFETENICWSDLTSEQKEEVTKDWTEENWKRLAYHLTECLVDLGEELDIVRE